MKHRLYNFVGSLYIILSLPPIVFLVTGRLQNVDPFYTIALGGVPLGIIFILFGTKRAAISHTSNIALKFAIAALSLNIPLFLSYALIRVGYQAFENVVVFSALFIALVSLNAFILAVFALLHAHSFLGKAPVFSGRHESH